MVIFDISISAYLPLSVPNKLKNPNFPIPFSIIMGDCDWVREYEEDYGKNCTAAQNINNEENRPSHKKSNYVFVNGVGHNIHMDSPSLFVEYVKNELLGTE